MRLGENPAKFAGARWQPSRVTIAVITYIPFLAGYFQQGLDVLKLCLASLLAHTPRPYDLLVFDNGSSPETIAYLTELRSRGLIQYLVLSDRNLGKASAWNFIFGAAPGEYLAYADSDVYFYPSWLDEELKVMATFQKVGMVSGLPAAHAFGLFTDSTLRLAEADPETAVERGHLIPDEWVASWGKSLGQDEVKFLAECRQIEQVRLTRRGISAYAVASHFQFLARLEVLRQMIPLRSLKPVGAESVLDEKLDAAGFARLSVSRPLVYHLGNTLTPEWQREAERLGAAVSTLESPGRAPAAARWLLWRPVRRLILDLYHRISRLVMISST